MPVATVEVYVELSELDEDDLVRHLRNRGYLCEKPQLDASNLIQHLRSRGYHVEKIEAGEDGRSESEWRLRRGEYDEALYALARELGPAYRDLPRAIEARS